MNVIVITGVGRAFSVGADIKAMDVMGDADFEEATGLYQALARQTRALEVPLIAAINGYALGGGLEIALMCDLRVAAASATIGLPDAELGFSPTGGLTFILPRLVGAGRAMDLLLGAEPVDAREAHRIGLVTRVFEDERFEEETDALAARIAGWPGVGIAFTKRLLKQSEDGDFNDDSPKRGGVRCRLLPHSRAAGAAAAPSSRNAAGAGAPEAEARVPRLFPPWGLGPCPRRPPARPRFRPRSAGPAGARGPRACGPSGLLAPQKGCGLAAFGLLRHGNLRFSALYSSTCPRLAP